jgi:hypothetical protein
MSEKNSELLKAAKKKATEAKEDIKTKQAQVEQTSDDNIDPAQAQAILSKGDNTSDDSDETIIIPGINVEDISHEPAPKKETVNAEAATEILSESDSDEIDPNEFKITDDDLKNVMPSLSKKEFDAKSQELSKEIAKYRKSLIINEGMTPPEANAAAKTRMNKLGQEIDDTFKKEHPNLAVVQVDKSKSDDLEFTPEEHEKLSKVKAIRLVAVEDMDLKEINILNIPSKERVPYLKAIDGGSLSRYSGPLPILGDYVSFRGAQIVQLASISKNENDHIEDVLGKKASLIYDRLDNGVITEKHDGIKTTMSYTDFVNWMPFQDIDLALFYILVASSYEIMDSPELKCNSCGNAFTMKFKTKSLLNLDDMSTDFKDIMEKILTEKANFEVMNKIHTTNSKCKRFKSPATNNIYEIQQPSIGRAIRMYSSVDEKDTKMVYYATYALYIQKIYVWDKDKQGYIPIDSNATVEKDGYDGISQIFDVLESLMQVDFNILDIELKKMLYQPKFLLKSVCPKCGTKLTTPLEIEDLVFIVVQGLAEVIE